MQNNRTGFIKTSNSEGALKLRQGQQQSSSKMPHNTSGDAPPDTSGKQNSENGKQDDNKTSQDHISLADVMSKLEGLSHLSQKMDSMAEDIKQIRVIQEVTKKIGKDLSDTRANVDQLKGSIAQLQEAQVTSDRERKEMISTVQQLKDTISRLEGEKLENQQNQQALAKELLTLRAQIKRQQSTSLLSQMEFEHLKIEAALRRNNLIIEGINENQNVRDNYAGEQVFYFVRDILGLKGIEIDMAYRLGRPRYGSSSPRPILVRFTRLGDRMEVWNAKYRLNTRNNSHFLIKEDLPVQLRPVQAALNRVQQEAKRFPDRYRHVAIRDFKLHIDGKVYGMVELELLPEELRPSSISTPGNTSVIVFFGKDSRFSNHYPSSFIVADQSFSNIEQYLAYSRAKIMERNDLAQRAMDSKDPVEAKRVLHLLREEPRQDIWETQRKDILFTGLAAKFSQNSGLKEYLLSSEERLLGEASKNRVWGIGLTLADRAKLNPRQWRGDNLLGETLMEVRKYLASSPSSQLPAMGETQSRSQEYQIPATGEIHSRNQEYHQQESTPRKELDELPSSDTSSTGENLHTDSVHQPRESSTQEDINQRTPKSPKRRKEPVVTPTTVTQTPETPGTNPTKQNSIKHEQRPKPGKENKIEHKSTEGSGTQNKNNV